MTVKSTSNPNQETVVYVRMEERKKRIIELMEKLLQYRRREQMLLDALQQAFPDAYNLAEQIVDGKQEQ